MTLNFLLVTSSRDAHDSIELYKRALSIARKNSLPTVSICLSYAHVLIDDSNDPVEAQRILRSCREEVYSDRDESNTAEYEELVSLLRSTDPDTIPWSRGGGRTNKALTSRACEPKFKALVQEARLNRGRT